LNGKLADALAAKIEEQVERAEHLLSLVPPEKLAWRPPWPSPAFTIEELRDHLHEALSGFLAVLGAAYPERMNFTRPPDSLREMWTHIEAGLRHVTDQDLARPIPTVFVPQGETVLTLLLGNLEHFINHKHQLFDYLKALGISVATPDLYRLRGKD
jgi:hypothetical protein